MELPNQIESISIARATNAAHYEYLVTVRKRTEEIRLENELWQRSVYEFREAFEKEDAAFKQYRASLKTSPLKKMLGARAIKAGGMRYYGVNDFSDER
jgi:hypothetical protein